MAEPLIIPVDDWKLEVLKRPNELQIAIVTENGTSHYVRLSTIGAAALKDYLNREFPS